MLILYDPLFLAQIQPNLLIKYSGPLEYYAYWHKHNILQLMSTLQAI